MYVVTSVQFFHTSAFTHGARMLLIQQFHLSVRPSVRHMPLNGCTCCRILSPRIVSSI